MVFEVLMVEIFKKLVILLETWFWFWRQLFILFDNFLLLHILVLNFLIFSFEHLSLKTFKLWIICIRLLIYALDFCLLLDHCFIFHQIAFFAIIVFVWFFNFGSMILFVFLFVLWRLFLFCKRIGYFLFDVWCPNMLFIIWVLILSKCIHQLFLHFF